MKFEQIVNDNTELEAINSHMEDAVRKYGLELDILPIGFRNVCFDRAAVASSSSSVTTCQCDIPKA